MGSIPKSGAGRKSGTRSSGGRSRARPGRRAALDAIADRLGRLSSPDDRALPEVVPALRTTLGLDVAVAYRISVAGQRQLDTTVLGSSGLSPWMIGAFLGFVRGAPPAFGLYDAARPEPRQRNRALALGDFRRRPEKVPLWPLLVRFGLHRSDQLRALVCDGPSLLAWVGGFREGRFGDADKAALDALVPALGRRLRLERQLGERRLRANALPHAMEAIPGPAFLLGPRRRIRHANAAGEALLAANRAGTLERLRSGLGFATTRVCSPGMPALSLAVREAPLEGRRRAGPPPLAGGGLGGGRRAPERGRDVSRR